MFEPFVEDEVPFDEYCQSMGEDGTWAGHMELQAASLVTHSNICIHRVCYNTSFILMVQDYRTSLFFQWHQCILVLSYSVILSYILWIDYVSYSIICTAYVSAVVHSELRWTWSSDDSSVSTISLLVFI